AAWLTNVDGTLFFRANDGVAGGELWISDGSEEGTVRVADLAPGAGTTSSSPNWFVAHDGQLYFTVNDGASGVELWRSDGTADGTLRLKDIRPGSGSSSPIGLTVI